MNFYNFTSWVPLHLKSVILKDADDTLSILFIYPA